jgi:hypothetical protein
MNAIMMLTPYKDRGVWMFDDPSVGLLREPFVLGIGEILDKMTEDIADAVKGFNLFFSSTEFPACQGFLNRWKADSGGTWYVWVTEEMAGWLCPALFKYFQIAPDELYFRAEAIKH